MEEQHEYQNPFHPESILVIKDREPLYIQQEAIEIGRVMLRELGTADSELIDLGYRFRGNNTGRIYTERTHSKAVQIDTPLEGDHTAQLITERTDIYPQANPFITAAARVAVNHGIGSRLKRGMKTGAGMQRRPMVDQIGIQIYKGEPDVKSEPVEKTMIDMPEIIPYSKKDEEQVANMVSFINRLQLIKENISGR